jgi:hypothetical protein
MVEQMLARLEEAKRRFGAGEGAWTAERMLRKLGF